MPWPASVAWAPPSSANGNRSARTLGSSSHQAVPVVEAAVARLAARDHLDPFHARLRISKLAMNRRLSMKQAAEEPDRRQHAD